MTRRSSGAIRCSAMMIASRSGLSPGSSSDSLAWRECAVKRLIADMLALDVDAEEFDAKLSVLKENVSHHAHEEEEDKLFPKVRKLMDADERAALGNEALAMFETLLQSEPRRRVPEETAHAAQLPAV